MRHKILLAAIRSLAMLVLVSLLAGCSASTKSSVIKESQIKDPAHTSVPE